MISFYEFEKLLESNTKHKQKKPDFEDVVVKVPEKPKFYKNSNKTEPSEPKSVAKKNSNRPDVALAYKNANETKCECECFPCSKMKKCSACVCKNCKCKGCNCKNNNNKNKNKNK